MVVSVATTEEAAWQNNVTSVYSSGSLVAMGGMAQML